MHTVSCDNYQGTSFINIYSGIVNVLNTSNLTETPVLYGVFTEDDHPSPQNAWQCTLIKTMHTN